MVVWDPGLRFAGMRDPMPRVRSSLPETMTLPNKVGENAEPASANEAVAKRLAPAVADLRIFHHRPLRIP